MTGTGIVTVAGVGADPPPRPSPTRGEGDGDREGGGDGDASPTRAEGTAEGSLTIWAATLADHSTPTTRASTDTTTSSSTTSTSTQASTTAEAVYKQVSPGVVTITAVVNSGRGSGQATGSGIVLDTNGNILTNAHVIA